MKFDPEFFAIGPNPSDGPDGNRSECGHVLCVQRELTGRVTFDVWVGVPGSLCECVGVGVNVGVCGCLSRAAKWFSLFFCFCLFFKTQ